MEAVLRGIARFDADVRPGQAALYAEAAKGQAPKVLMLSCSDSRVMPEVIAQCDPGDLFVIRNAGNVAPPQAPCAEGVAASVEFGIAALGVEHIVVMGHSACGAMKGLLEPEQVGGVPAVAAWLQHGRAALATLEHTCPGHGATPERTVALAKANVAQQLVHLQTYPAVAGALAAGKITLHGWFFDIGEARIHALDGETGEWAPLDAPADRLRAALSPRARQGAPPALAAA